MKQTVNIPSLNNQTIRKIAERIQVCTLNQGKWAGSTNHKREMREEQRRHGTMRIKKVEVILTENVHLKAALNLHGKIYNTHRKLSLASPIDGMRIVAAGKVFEHSAALSELINQSSNEVEKFIEQRPEVVIEARKALNDLFDETLIPKPNELREKFYNKFRYFAAPCGHSDWDAWLGETAQAIQVELQDRIVQTARHLIEVCSGDGKLYGSVLEKLNDVCEMAGDLNLLDDPIIAKAAEELKPIATDFSVEVLRDNEILRHEAARKASDILSVLDLG